MLPESEKLNITGPRPIPVGQTIAIPIPEFGDVQFRVLACEVNKQVPLYKRILNRIIFGGWAWTLTIIVVNKIPATTTTC